MSLLYRAARGGPRSVFWLFTDWRITGKENVPTRGPLIIAANHVSSVDIPLLAVSVGRRTKFMGKEELHHSRLSDYLFTRMGSFPVHRGRLDRQALRQALEVLADGWALVMYPEGTRSPDGCLREALPGAALVALRSGAPILPVAHVGTEQMKGLGWIFRRPRISVNIGSPFRLPVVNGRLTKEELARQTDLIMRRIADLLPPERRGKYAGGDESGD